MRISDWSSDVCSSDLAADTQSGEKAEEDAEAHADSLPMTADAIRAADIAVEAVRTGGLGSEIIAQATVAAAPNGEAIVTARAGGAAPRVYKRSEESRVGKACGST